MDQSNLWALLIALAGVALFYAAPRISSFLDQYVEGIKTGSGLRLGAATSLSYRPRDVSLEHLVTWATSPERDDYVRRRTVAHTRVVAAALVATAASLLIVAAGLDVASDRLVAGCAVLVASALMLWAAVSPYISARSAFRQRVRASASARVNDAIEAACTPDPATGRSLELFRLFELNRRQLDEYQLVTQRQQRSAFRLAQVAMTAAFLLILLGVWLALTTEDDIDKYVTSGLTGIGTILSGFLTRTFFRAYSDANEQMNLYYNEPQRTGRLMAAERIATNLRNDGVTESERTKLIDRVLTWDLPAPHTRPPANDGSGGSTGGATGQDDDDA